MLWGFDVHLINLPSRRDRLRQFRRELRSIGMDLPDVDVFEAIRPTDAAGFPSIGARGCFLSHLAVLKRHRGGPLLICEDDVNFRAERVEGAVRELLSGPWGVFYGSRNSAGTCAHMVAFNREVVPRVIDYLEAILARPSGHADGGPMHVDGAYALFVRDHPDVVLREADIAYQRRSRTDVHSLRWFDRTPVVAGAVQLLRALGSASAAARDAAARARR